MEDINERIDNTQDEISLKEVILKIITLWKYLLSKWLIIISAGLLGGVFGLTYSLMHKPVYKAELSFALEDDGVSGGGLGAAMGLASQFGFSMPGAGGAFSGDNLLMLMKSRLMVESALLTPVPLNGKKQSLAEYYIYFNKLSRGWSTKPKLKNIKFPFDADRSKFSLQQDSVLGSFYHNIIKTNLTVEKLDKKLSIITVSVTSENELFSKYFTEVLVKTVSNFYIETKTKKSVQNVNILQKQTDSVRRQLNSAITGVASSSDVNPNANPSLQILRTPSQRRQVDVQANQAILTELVRNLEVSKINLRKETPLIQVIDKPVLPLEKIRTGKLKAIVVGGFLCGLISVFVILIRKFYILIVK